MRRDPEAQAKWKADRDALRLEVLSALGNPGERSTDELMCLYEAARQTFEAWSPPADIDPEPFTWSDIFDRESERAWTVMEAVAGELINRWPDNIAERHQLLCTLADWHQHCDDNPEVARALLKLVQDSKHFRGSRPLAVNGAGRQGSC